MSDMEILLKFYGSQMLCKHYLIFFVGEYEKGHNFERGLKHFT